MTLTTGATLIGLGASAAAAWSFGGTVGTGILAGGLLAASVTLFALAWQRHVMRTDPRQALKTMAFGFLAKLVALGAGVAVLALVEVAGERADVRGFVLGFVGLAVVVLIPGTLDNVRVRRGRTELGAPELPPELQGGRTS